MNACARMILTSMLAVGALVPAGVAYSRDCDRECLDNWVNVYLDALIKHDPKAVRLAPGVRFTVNGQKLAIGDGIWRTMQGKGTFRIVVADVPAQQVAALVTFVEEGPTPKGVGGALAMRLRIKHGGIAEIEQKELRSQKAYDLMEAEQPRAAFTKTVPAQRRMARRELIETANMYFSGIQQNDGLGRYPLADDCDRYTGGVRATNNPTPEGEVRPDPKAAAGPSPQWSCREQFESGTLHFVSRIRDRRFVAVDEERGLVFAFAFFDHFAGNTRTFALPGGRVITIGPTSPFTWSISEIFKVHEGLIHEIEALEIESPYGLLSGWTTWEKGMSDKIQNETVSRSALVQP